MYARVLNFNGVPDIDAGVARLREKVIPILEQLQGYQGVTVSADRVAGVLGIVTLWETEEDRATSFEALADVRRDSRDVMGPEPVVENFEQTAMEVGSTPPEPGCALMITRISMDPAKVEANLAFFKAEVAPRIKAQAGFRGLRQMIDRQTGRGIVGTAWNDDIALKAAREDALTRREQAANRGVTFTGDSVREILLSQLR